MHAFVLDKNKKPLTPCRMARARILLKQGKAAVIRRYPFTIILKERTLEESTVREHRVKIDPGSKVTGIAVVQEETGQVVAAIEVEHRGERIKKALEIRRDLKYNRKARKTRYRKPRHDNRARRKGRLRPSLQSRVDNVLTWVKKLIARVPVTSLSQELAKFDFQQMENPDISGMEYNQGTLAGYEVREYLLEKWGRKCAYCGAENVPLQEEHILARSKGGTDRISNLTLACKPCNKRKGNRSIEKFLKDKPEVLARIKRQAKVPLKDATAVNTTRWALFRRLKAIGLPIECGSGGRTKFNRTQQGFPKAHWIDAACVGASTPEALKLEGVRPLLVKAMGHGKRQRCRTDKYGFPNRHAPRAKSFLGYQTGDIVTANIPIGKYQGKHEGRIAIRYQPCFRLGNFSVNPKYLTKIQCADGYSYSRE